MCVLSYLYRFKICSSFHIHEFFRYEMFHSPQNMILFARKMYPPYNSSQMDANSYYFMGYRCLGLGHRKLLGSALLGGKGLGPWTSRFVVPLTKVVRFLREGWLPLLNQNSQRCTSGT